MMFVVLYLLGCLIAMATMALIAHTKREAHGMSRSSATLVAVSAGLVWPLVAVGGVQAVGFLALAKWLGLMRSITGHGRHHEPVEASVDLAAHAAA